MICLMFPDQYPVWDAPVREYLKYVGVEAPHGASEGVVFIDLTKRLRFSLRENKDHPAKNLAELDHVIWQWSEGNRPKAFVLRHSGHHRHEAAPHRRGEVDITAIQNFNHGSGVDH